MICTSIQQMIRVAQAGAAKMPTEGYSYTLDRWVPTHFWVKKPGQDGRTYCVVPGKNFCNCKFHIENRKVFGAQTTCKHLEFIREDILFLAEIEAQALRYEEAEAEKGQVEFEKICREYYI